MIFTATLAARETSAKGLTPESAAIHVENLTKVYPNKVQALNGLSFRVGHASVFAMLGPNGAGKSTTVKILTTLSRASSGKAFVAGIDVTAQPQRVRKAIGCVAQKSGVDRESTGRENLTLQGRFHGMRGPELRDRVNELLARFNLNAAADRLARTYSGGMQRKLDIAMGLVHRPEVLFLDEPTTGLDPEARASLWSEIERLREEGLTILLTTHYLEEADRLAQQVAIVDQGRVVAQGPPEVLKAELRGDSIEIDFALAPTLERVQLALATLTHVVDLQVNGSNLYARATNGASSVPPILSALDAAGMTVASVKVSRPTLDDVYLRHTGRTMQQAEKGQS
jgi:ABC-2 type transport system ATP-binding protein